jgi:MFS family permease
VSTETTADAPQGGLSGRSEAVLLAGMTVSAIGTGVTEIAIPLFVYGTSGSVPGTAAVFIALALPQLVLAPFAGALADRTNRHALAVGSYILSAALLGALAFSGPLAVVITCAVLAQVVGTVSGPAVQAALPALAGDGYQRLIGRRTGLMFTAQAIGPALGGALTGLIGARYAILVDAGSFLVIAAAVGSIRHFDPQWRERRVAVMTSSVLASIRDGLRATRASVTASRLFLYWGISLAALPIALLAAIPYLRSTLGVSSLQYGVAVTCYAVGSIIGSLVCSHLNFHRRRRGWLLGSGLVYGVVNVVMPLGPGYIVFCVLWFVWGLSYGPEEVLTQLLFAEAIEDDLRGRLYSFMGVVFAAATILGYAVAGGITQVLGASWAMALAGVIFIAASVFSFSTGPLARSLRATETAG